MNAAEKVGEMEHVCKTSPTDHYESQRCSVRDMLPQISLPRTQRSENH
jgi:hypothetical protein